MSNNTSRQKVKPVCFGYYTKVDRVFRSCVGCHFLYECNPSEPHEEWEMDGWQDSEGIWHQNKNLSSNESTKDVEE